MELKITAIEREKESVLKRKTSLQFYFFHLKSTVT